MGRWASIYRQRLYPKPPGVTSTTASGKHFLSPGISWPGMVRASLKIPPAVHAKPPAVFLYPWRQKLNRRRYTSHLPHLLDRLPLPRLTATRTHPRPTPSHRHTHTHPRPHSVSKTPAALPMLTSAAESGRRSSLVPSARSSSPPPNLPSQAHHRVFPAAAHGRLSVPRQ